MTALQTDRVSAPADESDQSDGLAAAARVLRLEAEALTVMAGALDGRFSAALDILAAARGRVIVTGMGKSGHVARKIAATLASTGTPAYFVHPAEASHGDLGMITRDDVVVALSNSGHTAELRDLLEYSRRFSIPLVGITARADSILAEMADVALLLPPVPEACPMGLAPTTSTTASMALGDALAVALLERRGFSPQDFRVFHPGGRLGAGLLRVADLMHSGESIPLADPAMPMGEAIVVMTEKRLGCIGVVDSAGALLGIVTDGDIRRHMGEDLLARTAGEMMTSNPKTIRAPALAAEAVALMNEASITNVFVLEDGGRRPVGVLHIHDCLRAGVV